MVRKDVRGVRKIVACICALMLAFGALGVLAGCQAQEPEDEAIAQAKAEAAEAGKTYLDGTYTGVGQGQSGSIEVTITITNDRIVVDDIVEHGETPGLGGVEAVMDGTFREQIETAQSADIPGVEGIGAELTSQGVREAVQDALDQAHV